jgi:toxin ParE1/3/4
LPAYLLSIEAEEDLLAIHGYITQYNPAAADRLVHALYRHFELLADQPGVGAERETIRPGMRIWGHNRYQILYRIDAGRTLIVRVVHGRRDLASLFPPET